MTPNRLSSALTRFIFDYVDSIGFLEALLLLHSNPTKSWTVASLAQELRNSPQSDAQYLAKLQALKLVRKTSTENDDFVYDDSQSGFNSVIAELSENYRLQRHKINALVYSPLKKVRDFSDAFLLPGSDDKKGDRNG